MMNLTLFASELTEEIDPSLVGPLIAGFACVSTTGHLDLPDGKRVVAASGDGTAADRLLATAARSAEDQVRCPTVRLVRPGSSFC